MDTTGAESGALGGPTPRPAVGAAVPAPRAAGALGGPAESPAAGTPAGTPTPATTPAGAPTPATTPAGTPTPATTPTPSPFAKGPIADPNTWSGSESTTTTTLGRAGAVVQALDPAAQGVHPTLQRFADSLEPYSLAEQ